MMSEQAVLYGCIEGAFGSTKDFYGLYHRNAEVITALSEKDDWPPLNRDMFSVPMKYTETGFYRIQVIHFGASFNHFSDVWGIWLEKFERLLRRLYWHQVHLHLDIESYGQHDYLWKVAPDEIQRFYKQPPMPVSQWSFTGGPRQFEG